MAISDEELDEIRARVRSGKMTREEREQVRARLAEDDGDDADDLADDEIEFWEDARDGSSRGVRMTIRAAREHGPEWVRHLLNPDAEGTERATAEMRRAMPPRARDGAFKRTTPRHPYVNRKAS